MNSGSEAEFAGVISVRIGKSESGRGRNPLIGRHESSSYWLGCSSVVAVDTRLSGPG